MSIYLIDATEIDNIFSAQQLRAGVALFASTTAVLLVVVILLLWLRTTVAASNSEFFLYRSRPAGLHHLASSLPPTVEEAAAMVGIPQADLSANHISDYAAFATPAVSTIRDWFEDDDTRRRAVYLYEMAKRARSVEG
ncbi:membrane-associated protein, putative [Bodo saltans]|uniref:Membrane-associated protein, putative n=1 Tax=Bodo saltans TaxID=75058 RepID=A0A0S4KLR2_BODSA|nr:membrane-associated protein, putative [Bodo saltans]|eukprot:CUI15350.1 membrane-associated protein, putative [Bodo saltans]